MKAGWEVGAALTLVGSIGINLGTNCMKLGYMSREALELGSDNSIWRYWQWQAGMLLFVAGNIANFAARAFASQSLLTGLGSVQFISNLVFVVLVLKEKVPRRCVLATFLIVVGNIILVVFGSKESPSYSVAQLAARYRQDSMAAYMMLAYAGAVPLSCSLYLFGQQAKRLWPNEAWPIWTKMLPFLYSLYSSILGAHAVLFATSLCIVLKDLVEGTSVFREWYTYFVFIGMIGMSIFWVGQLDKGLMLFPAVVIVPLLEILWVLFIMVSGGIYFGDFEAFSRLQLIMFGVGVFVLLVGMFCLMPQKAAAEAPALEEALRSSGFGRDTKAMQNPAFDEDDNSKPARTGPKSALSALQIHVRPKRNSFSVLSSARQDVQHSMFVSAKKTAGLTVGLGSNKYLRAMSIFAMPMIPFGEPEAVQYSTRQGGRNDRMGTVHNVVSRLLSVDSTPDMFDRVFEPRPATRLPLGPRTTNNS